MSTLRDLLASLWAAVWLRGWLLGIRVRRMLGSGRPAERGPSGPDYHLAVDEVPVEGRDYDPSALPPDAVARLGSLRAELLDAARDVSAGGRHYGRTRRRTVSVVAASLLALSIVGVGANALVTGSTGVPAVDRALGIYEAGMENPNGPGPLGPTKGDLHPDPSRQNVSLGARVADGSRIASSFYVASSGQVCSFTTDLEEAGHRARLGALACQPPAELSERLAERGIFIMATNVWGDSAVLSGFVRGNTASLNGRGPGGSLQVSLGDAWNPDLSDLEAVVPFVAIGGRGDEASQRAGDLMVLTPDLYTFEAQTTSGDQVQISP